VIRRMDESGAGRKGKVWWELGRLGENEGEEEEEEEGEYAPVVVEEA